MGAASGACRCLSYSSRSKMSLIESIQAAKTLSFFLLATALSISGAQKKVGPLAQVEVIPGDLSIRSYSHRIDTGSKRIACFSYVTNGLERHGQHEVVLTVPRKGLGNDVPPDVVEIFKSLRDAAVEGHRAGAYEGFVLEPGTSFLGRAGNWGFVLIPAQVFDGVDVPFEALAAVLVKGDETELLKKRLTYRIASMLGAEYKYYPCPPWSEPDRKPLCSAKDCEASLMAKSDWRYAPGLSVRMSPGSGQKSEIDLTVEMSGLPQLNSIFANPTHPDSPAFNLLTLPDPLATMRLAWFPHLGKTGIIFAIPGLYLTGGFLLIRVKEGIEEKAEAVEDGFELCLRPESWGRLRASMALAISNAFPLAAKDRILRVEFLRRFTFDEFVEMPYHATAVGDYLVYAELKKRVPDVGSVEDYIKALSKAASAALKDSKKYDAHGVLIAVGVKPGKKARVWCDAVEGSLPEETLRNLESVLESVPTVEVKDAPIAFAIHGSLWNRTVKEFPAQPAAWIKAIADSGKTLRVPDELFAAIWPD